ncbi:TolC family protein [Flavobacterium xueshanense]|uniref:Outer membrane protein TolC n=1 Tax=Flavobacterium xueshanense TaxID=935223 RepID=A0A1I2FAE5_9FLAO|nr:TolC family protein [Flavobacterium xueshanense]SFF02185.1 Outer membrane protein TolC [Flavobacterium xueshanense]
MKNKLVILLLFLLSISSNAQQILTLEDCYTLVNKNYPLSKQTGLLQQKLSYEIEALSKGKLPKIDVNAQATYQNEVIGLPATLPGVEPLNKDQYRATLDVNQLIYNGGRIDANAKLKEAQGKTQQQQIEVSLYQLKSRINQYYFSILLLQEKSALLLSKKELLESKVKEVQSAVKFGAILPASEQVLEAEIIKINQQLTEIKFEKIKLLNNLSELTFTTIDSDTILLQPNFNFINTAATRPELVYYDFQNQQLEFSKNVISKSNLPKINAFGQAGYGNPGLNMLDNSFQTFYVLGLKANWNVFDWGKNKTDIKALDISKEIVTSEKETFELNSKMQLEELDYEVKKMEQLILSDSEIIIIREKIMKSSDAQMKNGVITSSEYLIELTNLFEAKNILNTHEVQLSLAKSSYEIIKGK